MWYVNDEGYSGRNTNRPCFILTMWYVNLDKTDMNEVYIKGFILTMWYVNALINGSQALTDFVLY